MRPGVNTISQESSPPATLPTDTGQTYAVIVSERGPTGAPLDIRSFTDYQRQTGARTNLTARYFDAVEGFFKFGGSRLKVVRAVGPAAAKAVANLDDAVAAAPFSLVATAVGHGTWYNGLNIEVEDQAGARRIVLTHDTDPSVTETSPWATTQDELVSWSQESKYIRLGLGASADLPAVIANVPLAGGLDDYAGADTAVRVAALATFDPDDGPGNVAIPGATTAAEWQGILDHAEAFDRSAVLDYPDTADEATLVTLAGQLRASGRFGAGFAGWITMPGEGGKTKTVAPSLIVCGKIARHDADTNGLGQNKPVAGLRRGRLNRALGVSQSWPDAEMRQRLNEAGVNLIRERFGVVAIYGWRSLADPVADKHWVNFGHRRLQTALAAKAKVAMEDFLFEEIDGEGILLGNVAGALIGQVCQPYYQAGSLYGASPELAYRVDTKSVNDETTAENRELHASVTVVESEFAEEINVYIIKNMITEGVSA